jgi:ribosomal-protein-alanine N-acetyltransferase
MVPPPEPADGMGITGIGRGGGGAALAMRRNMMAAGAVAGYGILAVAADEAHLLNLCIDPDFRQRGLARKLLNRLLELATEHRAGIIFLEVRPSNLAAIALYETAGFRRVAVRRNYYPAREGREDAVVMTLRMDEEAAPEAVESPGGLG